MVSKYEISQCVEVTSLFFFGRRLTGVLLRIVLELNS